MSLSAREPVATLDPNEVPLWVSVTGLRHYFQLATVTVLIYEAIITIDKEAKYFWRRPRNPVDFVYFANRYSAIFGAISFLFWDSSEASQVLCDFATMARNIANWITLMSIDYILMLRVLALYSQEKWLSVILKGLLALEAVVKMGIVIYGYFLQQTAVIGLARDTTACSVGNPPPSWGVAAWVIPTAYGVVLMVFALYKATEYWKLSAGFKGFTLVKVLVVDQIVYFSFVIASSSLNMINMEVQSASIFLSNVVNELGNPAFLSILGTRMLFNLRDAAERGVNQGTSFKINTDTVSDMDFAQPKNQQRPEPEYADIELLEHT